MLNARKYIIRQLGIDTPLLLYGALDILRSEESLCTVFLIDEYHDDLVSINHNVSNAIELINNANVTLVGVESHSGGRQWDQFDKVYIEDDMFDLRADNISVNGRPEFAIGLKKHYTDYIYGVECEGMLSRIQCDLSVKDNPFYGKPVTEHPLNKERSKHFIRTLFEKRQQMGRSGNLILNCGRDHNTHIQEWIENGEIDGITNCQANYVRLNTINQ